METKVKEELENEEIAVATKPWNKLLGCLMYAMIGSKPDLLFYCVLE